MLYVFLHVILLLGHWSLHPSVVGWNEVLLCLLEHALLQLPLEALDLLPPVLVPPDGIAFPLNSRGSSSLQSHKRVKKSVLFDCYFTDCRPRVPLWRYLNVWLQVRWLAKKKWSRCHCADGFLSVLAHEKGFHPICSDSFASPTCHCGYSPAEYKIEMIKEEVGGFW